MPILILQTINKNYVHVLEVGKIRLKKYKANKQEDSYDIFSKQNTNRKKNKKILLRYL